MGSQQDLIRTRRAESETCKQEADRCRMREREREQRRVAALSETLGRYKREIGNCQTAAREMRDEEARLERLHDRYLEEAEKAERQARVAEEEAARLEREAGPANSGL